MIHAVRFVAARLQARTLAPRVDETRNELVEADRERYGEESLLDRMLPTSNQILAYCDNIWDKAMKLAGIKPHRPPPPAGRRRPAIYGALHGTWPSKPTLYHFATMCGIRLGDPTGLSGPSARKPRVC